MLARCGGALVGGKYITCGPLLEGATGVHRANEIGSGRPVVLKELTQVPGLASEERPRRNRLLRELVRLLRNVLHPALASVYEYLDEGDRVYVAMEWVDGMTLEQAVLSSPQELSRERVLRWAISLCECLHYLHDRPRPLLTPALNPTHLMVTETGQIKMINFGLGRIFAVGDPGLFADESSKLVDEFDRFGGVLAFMTAGREVGPESLDETDLSSSLRALLGLVLRRRTQDRPPDFLEMRRRLRAELSPPDPKPNRGSWARLIGAMRSMGRTG